MAQTITYKIETHNGHKFEWQNTEYTSPTGGDHTRLGYRVDGKRTSQVAFYKMLRESLASDEAA